MLNDFGRFGLVSQLESLPVTDNGLDAVRATLRKMAAIIRKYSSDVTTLNTARQILTANGITDIRPQKKQAIAALQGWVRDHIVYVYDPRNTELLQTPPQTLSIGTGDCDDKTMLLLAMLESVGFTTELLAVGGTGAGWQSDCGGSTGAPPPYSHVLGAVRYGALTGRYPKFLDGWVTLETIVPGARPGYMPPGVKVVMPYEI
jgi:transglutaminase-like putative cysteine protease